MVNISLIKYLASGGVAIIPTDTTYGLVCRAEDSEAIARMFTIKPRENKLGTFVASGVDQLKLLGSDEKLIRKAERFWPGPFSVVFGTKAIRIPDNQFVLDLCDIVGPLATTSANMPGEPVVNTIKQAQELFGKKIGYYVDGGDLSAREPSTIIGFDEAGKLIIYRIGAGKIDPALFYI